MSEGASLAYEQPLAPGEARLDLGKESVGLSWRPCFEDTFWEIVGASLPAALFMGLGFLQIPRGSSASAFDWCIAGGLIALSVLMLARVVTSARRVRFVWASRERLTWSRASGRGERTIPMSEVRAFVVQATWKDYALFVRLYEPRSRSAEALLAQVDQEFVKRAAFELNALLASGV